MRAPRLALAIAALLLGAPLGSGPASAAVPLGPGPSSGFYTYLGGGPQLDGTAALTYYPRGMNVWVLAGTAHVARLEATVAGAVAQLRRHGVDFRYRGVAARPSAAVGTVAGLGAVTVTESVTATGPCANPPTASGLLREGVALPLIQDLGFIHEIENAQVSFCPQVWAHGSGYLLAVGMHELGHAAGLGHYRETYRGVGQVMNPVVPDDAPTSYQAGDVNGLRYLSYQAHRVATSSAVDGTVEHWSVANGRLTVTGWAITGRTSLSTSIEITDDGHPANSFVTDQPRPDITRAHHTHSATPGFRYTQQLNTGSHRYCVVATDPLHVGAPKVLGCKQLRRPDPGPTPAAPPRVARTSAMPSESIDLRYTAVIAVLLLGFGVALVFVIRRRRRR